MSISRDELIAILRDKLEKIPENESARFRKQGYKAVINEIQKLNDEKITANILETIKLTDHMRQKIEKIIATNATDDDATIDIDGATSSWLLKIAGIGHVKAKELEKNGVKTEKDLLSPKIFDTLPEETRVFLTKKPLEKISRESITEFETKFAQNFAEEFTIVGSYRRGAATSGDIDLMVVGDAAIFQRAQNVLRDIFELVAFATGEYRVSGVITLPNGTNAHIDLFCVPYEERAAQMLYSTGSMLHNVKMRGLAKRRGMLLNQHGLFNRKTGTKIPTLTERDIYNGLEMTYVPPTERN